MYMNHIIVYIYKFKTTDQHCGKQQSAPALGTGQEKKTVSSVKKLRQNPFRD